MLESKQSRYPLTGYFCGVASVWPDNSSGKGEIRGYKQNKMHRSPKDDMMNIVSVWIRGLEMLVFPFESTQSVRGEAEKHLGADIDSGY